MDSKDYGVEEHGERGRQRNGSPFFYSLLERMAEIHDKKSTDYASNDNPYGNYLFAGELSKLFINPDDSGFLGRIGEKLYRLANLENPNNNGVSKVPLYESIEDTEIDICVITLLWMACRRETRTRTQEFYGGAAGGGKTTQMKEEYTDRMKIERNLPGNETPINQLIREHDEARDAMRNAGLLPQSIGSKPMREVFYPESNKVAPSGGQIYDSASLGGQHSNDAQMEENRRIVNNVKDTIRIMTPSHRKEISRLLSQLD